MDYFFTTPHDKCRVMQKKKKKKKSQENVNRPDYIGSTESCPTPPACNHRRFQRTVSSAKSSLSIGYVFDVYIHLQISIVGEMLNRMAIRIKSKNKQTNKQNKSKTKGKNQIKQTSYVTVLDEATT